MKVKASDLFVGAILRGYEAEKKRGKRVTPSGIWDHICIEAIHTPNGFNVLLEWDTSKAKNQNRIRTIMECIEAGSVPGLCLGNDAKGRVVVEDLPF